nr:MAG: hypothetical protein [Caudoviricetes sp.]
MALNEQNIVIQPNVGIANTNPKITFSAADASTNAKNIVLNVYPTSNGTLSFEGNTGQLFSITDSMSGTIFSVNDISGIPSIEVLDTGLVKLAQYSGNVAIGQATANAKLHVNGDIIATNINVGGDISWTQSTDTYSRNSGIPATTPVVTDIHLNMRRCTLLDDGTVNYYLNSANSAQKSDGTDSNLTGADGMVMVEIPAFYVKFTPGATRNWAISLFPAAGYTPHPAFMRDGVYTPYRYYGAYDACVWTTGTTYQSGLNYDDNIGTGQNWDTGTAKLASVSGIYPAVGITRAEARTLASNRGSIWRQSDYYLVNAIQLLYLVEYGSFNSQSKIGLGNVQVATGYPASSANQTDSPHSVAGKSNSIGNATGAVASTTRDTAWMSYRGIENFYGNCWNFVDGFNINNNIAYVNNTRSQFTDDTATNYNMLGTMINANGYPTNVLALSSGFLPSAVGGGTGSYLTDYYYQSSGWRVALVGGNADAGLIAGAFDWVLNHASSLVSRALGARLVF